MALPKPDSRLTPTQDEFDEWCLHPVTRWVAAAHDLIVQRVQAQWIRESWTNDPGQDAETLIRRRQALVARADAYAAFLQTEWRQYCDVIDGPGQQYEQRVGPTNGRRHADQAVKAPRRPTGIAH